MLKVAKFGGSSVAGAEQFRKVKAIVEADESRRVIVISAAGKRDGNDHTDHIGKKGNEERKQAVL